MLQEHGGYKDCGWHASHLYRETLRIPMMFQDNCTIFGHWTHGWILQFCDGWETYFCHSLSMSLCSIRNLTKTKHQTRRSCMSLKVIQAPCLMHLLLKDSVMLSTARPSSSFEVVAHKVFCRSFGCFLLVCRTGQWWAHRNAAQIQRFAKSHCVHIYTQSRWDRPKSHHSKPWGNNSDVLGIEWAAAGMCTGCPIGAKQSSTHLAIEHWKKWLW